MELMLLEKMATRGRVFNSRLSPLVCLFCNPLLFHIHIFIQSIDFMYMHISLLFHIFLHGTVIHQKYVALSRSGYVETLL